ncbi:MAG: hypothetical protein Phog2KO_08700 [Phototrophicaceae bacterium]
MSDFFDFDPESDEVINREIIEHEDPATDRSLARRVTLQCLYEIDTANHKIGEVLISNIEYSPSRRSVRGYITNLVKGIVTNRPKLDAVLQKYAPDWPIDQVAVIDRNILRIALYELGVETRTPVGVAIDEAIELAKLFGAENTPRFINGVLGSVADNLPAVRSYLGADSNILSKDNNPPDTSETSE